MDKHCVEVFVAYLNGLLTRTEAIRLMQEHGDRMAYDMLTHSFSTASYINDK